MIDILGENYEEMRGACEVLWRGDLLLLDASCGDDSRAYMLCISDDRESFRLVNYVGYKAGTFMQARVPKEAAQAGSLNIRLSWLRENWDEVIPVGSFETTKFLRWKSHQATQIK